MCACVCVLRSEFGHVKLLTTLVYLLKLLYVNSCVATRVRLSPAIDREEQTTKRVRNLREKSSYLPIPVEQKPRAEVMHSLRPTVLFIQISPPKTNEHLGVFLSLRAEHCLAHFLWEVIVSSALLWFNLMGTSVVIIFCFIFLSVST